MRIIISALLMLILAGLAYGAKNNQDTKPIPEGVEKINGPYNRPYYVMLPEKFDPSKPYWLYVLVHGAGGDGLCVSKGKSFKYKEQCIFVGPSFPESSTEGYYQILGGNADKQLDQIFAELKKKYKLHDRFMLQGHSGGSQFSHRYTMANPKSVLACIATSGGSWGETNSSAKYIPFIFSCGELDTGKSVPTSAMGRLDWYRQFRDSMIKGQYFYTTQVVPGKGHGAEDFAAEKRGELFLLATTGLWPNQRAELDLKLSEIRNLMEGDNKALETEAINKLRSFKPISKPNFSSQSIDDTDPEQQKKTHKINEYGYTTNPQAEKYLAERFNYYLEQKLIPELKN